MAQQSAEQIIPLDFAEAFADAVLVHEIWNPEYPERQINLLIGCPNVFFLNCARTCATIQTA